MWIFLVIWFVCAIMYHIFNAAEEENPEGSKTRKACCITKWTFVGILGLSLVCLILYVLGWIWYFFCGGFLLFEDQPFLDKVFCGFLSVALLILVFGGIAVICGWDPEK